MFPQGSVDEKLICEKGPQLSCPNLGLFAADLLDTSGQPAMAVFSDAQRILRLCFEPCWLPLQAASHTQWSHMSGSQSCLWCDWGALLVYMNSNTWLQKGKGDRSSVPFRQVQGTTIPAEEMPPEYESVHLGYLLCPCNRTGKGTNATTSRKEREQQLVTCQNRDHASQAAQGTQAMVDAKPSWREEIKNEGCKAAAL